MSNFKKIVGASVLLILALVIFHKSLLLAGCRLGLHRLQSSTQSTVVSYDTLQWEGDAIVLRGLSVKNPSQELTIDRVELQWHCIYQSLCLDPTIVVVHPQLSILALNSAHQGSFPFLYQSNRFKPHLSISNGVLQCPQTRYYFSLSPESEGSTLVLSHQPDLNFLPLLKASIAPQDKGLHVTFELNETDLSRATPLMAFLFPSLYTGDESLTGEVALEGGVTLDWTTGIQEMTLQGEVRHLLFIKDQDAFQLHCEEATASLFYTSEEQCEASCTVKGGGVLHSCGLSLHDLNGRVSMGQGGELQSSFLGNLFYLDQELSLNVQAQGQMAGGLFKPSSCHVEWNGMYADAHSSDQGIEISLQGDAQPLLQFALPHLCSELHNAFPLDWKLILDRDRELLTCTLTGLIDQDPLEASASFCLSPSKRGLKEAALQVPLLHLKPYTPFLQLFLPDLKVDGAVSCEAVASAHRLQMTIQPESLIIDHALASVQFPSHSDQKIEISYDWKTGRYCVEAPFSDVELTSHQVPLTLDHVSGELKLTPDWLEIPAWEATCESIVIQGSLKADLSNEKLLSVSTTRIDATCDQLQHVLSRFPAFAKWTLPITGDFHSGPKGFLLTMPLHQDSFAPQFILRGSLSDLSFPLNSLTSVRQGHCDLIFDSRTGSLFLEKGEGKWDLLDGTSLSIQTKRFHVDFSQEPLVDFSVKVVDGKKEFIQFEGKIESLGREGWALSLDPKQTHLAGIALNVQQCQFNTQAELKSFEMKPVLKIQEIYSLANFLKNTGVLKGTQDLKSLSELSLQGKLHLHLFSEEFSKGISLLATSSDLSLQGSSYSPFVLKACENQGGWRIDQLQAGPLSLRGAISLDREGFSLPQFEGTWKSVELKGTGYFKTTTRQFHCSLESVKADLSTFTPATSPVKGSFLAGARFCADFSDLSSSFHLSGEANLLLDLQAPLAFTANNKKLIRFSYHPQEGLESEGIDLQIKQRGSGSYLADLKGEKLLMPKEGYLSIKGLQISLTPACIEQALCSNSIPKSFASFEWEGNLQASGDFQLTPSTTTFQGSINPGRYGWEGKFLKFEQIQIAYDKKNLHLRTKTHIEEQPLWSSLQLDLDKEIYGTLKLLDHPKSEGLKITFRSPLEGWQIEGIQGSFYGLECQLKPQMKRKLSGASSLTGEIKVDLSRLTLLLPRAVQKGLSPLQLGSGYEWQGDLVLWQDTKQGFVANGTLKGKEFEALGYRFEALQGTLEANSQRIRLSQLKIEEAGGLIGMKKLELTKVQDKWQLSIPQIEVHSLRPSLMRKSGVPQGSIKPFVIQHFVLSEIRGELGDLSTFEGSGYLTFVNQFKKESSILDLPLEMIKKIGLDLGLLTPVEGEFRIQLRGDKLYLLSLDHAYSEAKRSEFYLAPSKHPSYIDLTGGVHIDLKMRQDVMLKVIEPFTLTIRGTLDKPRYGLQF